jgi:hypothetical protein
MLIFGQHQVKIRARRAAAIVAALACVAGFGGTAVASAMPARTDPAIGEAGVCANCKPPLTYRNGPVMGTASLAGTITITPVYWTPPGYSFDSADANYRTLNNRYISDIAAASGTNGNIFGILPEYYSTTGGVSTSIKYSIVAGTPIVDTNSFPAAGQCTPTPGQGYTACITDPQTQAELASVLAANGLPGDLAHIYLMFFPPNAQTSLGSTNYSLVQYLGYHGHVTTAAGTIVYANMPFNTGYIAQTPNNDADADASIDTMDHELAEAITDPTNGGGWADVTGNEIGDECADNYGPPIGMVTTALYGPQAYNQVINGHFYYTQTEFSNAAYRATGVGTGCRQSAFSPGGSALRPAALRGAAGPLDASGAPGTVTVDASPSRLPADGASTSAITVTVRTAAGDPVAGDTVDLLTRDDNATPGRCGTLNTGSGPGSEQVTDAAGEVTATYTSSTANADCYVLATEIGGGSTNQAIIAQGIEGSTAPSVTQALPGSLIAGGPVATFTATAANPSRAAISDARLGLYLTGDANGSVGVDASQLTLSYKDPATNGQFVDVPLAGSTADDGEIDAFITPDTAESLGAGATREVTFHLVLASGAPDSAVTGAPLRIETDLDQFDPADGSQTNLDRAGPADVPVIQAPGDTITFSGKLSTSVAPTVTTPGSAVLVAKTCRFMSDGATCRLTGTAVLTLTGGTLTGFISTDDAKGAADRTVSFTETFTYSGPNAATGTGTAEVSYFDSGNTSSDNLTAADTTAPTKVANVETEEGTITLANPAP